MKNSKSGQKPSQNKTSNLGGGGYNPLPVRLLNKFAKRHPLAPCGRGQKINLSHAKIRFSGEGLKHKEHVINKTILRFVPQNDCMFLPDMDSAERNFRWTFRERLLGGVSSRRVKNSDKGCQHLQDYHSKAGLLRHQSSDASQRQHHSLAPLADLHSVEQNLSVNDFAIGMAGMGADYNKQVLQSGGTQNLENILNFPLSIINSIRKRKVGRHCYADMKKCAFTLAEVLITLLIIGVVAAMTLPNFIHNITERSNATKVAVFNSKFIAGLNSAKAQGDMGTQFKNTYDFLKNGLSLHLKMAMICKNDELEKCMGYDEIKYETESGSEKTVKVNSLKTAKKLNIKDKNFSDTAAFIMGDGTPVLLTYNTNCNDDGGIDKTISGCVAGLFDINGSSRPNMFLNKISNGRSEARDLRSFNGAAPAGSCVGEIGTLCIVANSSATGDSAYDSMFKAIVANNSGYDRPTYVHPDGSIKNDNQKLAMDYCNKVAGGHLPSMTELAQIATELYGGNYSSTKESSLVSANWSTERKNKVFAALGINDNPTYLRLWSSDTTPVPNFPQGGRYWLYSANQTGNTSIGKHNNSDFNGPGTGVRVVCLE